jgi:hypothetical protein
MSEDILPTTIALGVQGGPQWQTQVVIVDSGHEQRNAVWATPLGRWEIAYQHRAREEITALVAFFNARQGKADTFYFRDWSEPGVVLKRVRFDVDHLQVTWVTTDVGTISTLPIVEVRDV